MTLSLAAVFIPVLFMSGIVGRLFREFAVTIGVAVLVSGIVSLTLTPMMASRFLKDPRQIRHGAAYRATEAAFDASVRFYSWTLLKVLDHRRTTMAFSAVILIATGYLFWKTPKGSSRRRIATRSACGPRPRRTSRSTAWWRTNRPWRTSCRATRTWTGS